MTTDTNKDKVRELTYCVEAQNYETYKAMLDKELAESAESFVRIGYLLKIARDTDILAESGYSSVTEFAQAEYGLDKSQVSRFVHINDRFSENGYSDQLTDRYKGFGYAKLVLMLSIPEEITGELTPDYTKSEIQSIKEEIDEEKKITDIEVYLEGEEPNTMEKSNMYKTLYQLFEDEPELYIAVADAYPDKRDIMDVLANGDGKLYSVRVRGLGRYMMTIKNESISLVSVRTNERNTYTWDEFLNEIGEITSGCGLTKEETVKAWQMLYGISFPKAASPQKVQVAPVQPHEEAPKKKKKKSKVKKAESQTPKNGLNSKAPEILDKPEVKETVLEEPPKQDVLEAKECDIDEILIAAVKTRRILMDHEESDMPEDKVTICIAYMNRVVSQLEKLRKE
jgi:hypothetical protein